MDEKSLQNFFKWSLGSLVVPAGLAAYGVPWPTIFAITLMLTVAVGVGAFRKYRTWFLIALIAACVFAGWTVKREQGYSISWIFCRNQRYVLDNSGDLELFKYWIGVHTINDNPFDLWIRSDEQTFSLAGRTAGSKLDEPPVRIPAHNRHFLNSTRIDFNPPVKLTSTDAGEGRIRYVMRYGRTPEKLDKTLIVSGRLTIEYPPDGDTIVSLRPDMDSEVPTNGELCRVPPT